MTDFYLVKTVGGNAKRSHCVFPFIYNKKPFYACTCLYDNVPWCATTENFDKDKQWGYCVPDTTYQGISFSLLK